MWRVNEVLKLDDQLYRILAINSGMIYWIQVDTKNALPEVFRAEQLYEYLDNERLIRFQDPYIYLINEEPALDSIAFSKRDKAYNVIKELIQEPNHFDPSIRAGLINRIKSSGLVSKPTIYKYLRRYWQRGQIPNALLPDYKNSGAPGKTRTETNTQKNGRKRKFGDGEGCQITIDIERLFRIIISKHLLKDNPLKTTEAHNKFKVLYAQYYPNEETKNYPTLRQFRYFYHREYTKPQLVEAQSSPNNFKKDKRPLLATATSSVLGPGSRYEIDATIADLYLVANDDRSKIVGRPTVYVIIDVFSRMIAGFYIGLDNPSYAIAMQAVSVACSSKVSLCKEFDITVSDEEWPVIGLPSAILADRGEVLSEQAETLVNGYNIHLETAPPRRGDAKGIVESCFRTIQAEFKPYTPGVVEGNRIKKHGETDYRLEAVLTLNEFTQIILETIIFRNNFHVLDKYDRDEDLPEDIPSIPLYLWNWGIENRMGKLRTVDAEQLRVSLLPRTKVSMSPLGINAWGLYYNSSEILREGWLHRSEEIQRPQNLKAAYDPKNANKIYLFASPNSQTYWTCSLAIRSRAYTNMSFWEVWEKQYFEKHVQANAKHEEITHRIAFNKSVQKIIENAKKQTPKADQSNSERIRQIRANKKDQKQKANLPLLEKNVQMADIIKFNKPTEEEDYKLPFSPELFNDEE
ncbi:MAG: DDE-type integrase/transposase/recombinase [Gammaproteobacteria bacterium]|nr:DDE-type integrase/transposase/recombinase [Gammaproteobacteria bacterium]